MSFLFEFWSYYFEGTTPCKTGLTEPMEIYFVISSPLDRGARYVYDEDKDMFSVTEVTFVKFYVEG